VPREGGPEKKSFSEKKFRSAREIFAFGAGNPQPQIFKFPKIETLSCRTQRTFEKCLERGGLEKKSFSENFFVRRGKSSASAREILSHKLRNS